jgi:uncharacterized Zn-binding protein involved in type VI secretion
MAKLPARKGDAVSNDSHGDGEITSGDGSVLFLGKPVATVGDSVKFADDTEGTINEGGACVLINGKRLALVGDSTTESGTINDGAGSIEVDEGVAFVELGPNVIFSSKPEPTFNQHFKLQYEDNGKPAKFVPYRIKTTQGIVEGITDENGATHILGSDSAEIIEIELLDGFEMSEGS